MKQALLLVVVTLSLTLSSMLVARPRCERVCGPKPTFNGCAPVDCYRGCQPSCSPAPSCCSPSGTVTDAPSPMPPNITPAPAPQPAGMDSSQKPVVPPSAKRTSRTNVITLTSTSEEGLAKEYDALIKAEKNGVVIVSIVRDDEQALKMNSLIDDFAKNRGGRVSIYKVKLEGAGGSGLFARSEFKTLAEGDLPATAILVKARNKYTPAGYTEGFL